MRAMDDLLTTKQLMKLLQVDRTTIYRMINDGRLPAAVRVGGQWRFSRQMIELWLKDQNGQSPTEPDAPADSTNPPPLPTADALPLYCLQPIQEVFAQTSETGALTTDVDGNPITPISNPAPFCSLILSTEKGRRNCQASWKRLAANSGRPRLEKCHAGLTYAGGRIVVQDAFVAMSFVGQFTVDAPNGLQTRVARIAEACGVDAQELDRAAREIHVLSIERAERLLNLLQLVADTFSHIGEERLQLLSRLKQVAEIASPKP